jgi:hypothetical protein
VVREAPVQARIAVRRFRGSNPGETALIALGIEEHDLERDGMLEIEECHPNYPNYVEVCFVPPLERLPAYRYRPQA